jgi:hypothetical protein
MEVTIAADGHKTIGHRNQAHLNRPPDPQPPDLAAVRSKSPDGTISSSEK